MTSSRNLWPQLSIRALLLLSFIGMSVVLVVGYTLLSMDFFGRGLHSITASNMARALDYYLTATPPEKRMQLQNFHGYSVAPAWELTPEPLRKIMKKPKDEGILYHYAHDGPWLEPPPQVDFVLCMTREGVTYYIMQSITPETLSPLIGRNAASNLRVLLAISCLTALCVGLFIYVIINRVVVRPSKALERWASTLTPDKLRETPPNFFYPEFNELAALIRRSLLSTQAGLEREELFLRYSSHELRTPISVIRNSLELHEKIISVHTPNREAMIERIMRRVDRASLTMAHLTDTLLWMGRGAADKIPQADVDMEALLHELVDEARYLLTDKEVDVVTDTAPCTLTLPGAAARIALGNLIRNAFQHTQRGIIHILQRDGCVEVVNYMARENDSPRDVGFGLGLQLIEKLAAQFGWDYANERAAGRNSAMLCLKSTKTEISEDLLTQTAKVYMYDET